MTTYANMALSLERAQFAIDDCVCDCSCKVTANNFLVLIKCGILRLFCLVELHPN